MSQPDSPLPWTLDEDGAVWAANGKCVGEFLLAGDAAHIVAAVTAWPALLAEADRREASHRELAMGMAAQEDRDDAACEKAGIPPRGCDTADALADEVLALRAQLAAARSAVKGLPYMAHSEYCNGWEDLGDFAGCDCSAGSFNDTIESARRALGLEG